MLGARAAQVCRCGKSESARCRCRGHGHAHGRVVSDRSRCTSPRVERQRTSNATWRTRRGVVAGDPPSVPGAGPASLAEKRAGTSSGLHLKYVGEAATVFRLRGRGAVQQPGGELDAARSTRTQELAACGQRAGRTESGGDPFRGGILPSNRSAGEGISLCCVAGTEPPQAQRTSIAHPCPLVRCPRLIPLGSLDAYRPPRTKLPTTIAC